MSESLVPEFTPEFHIPLLAFAIIATQSAWRYKRGQSKELVLADAKHRGASALASSFASYLATALAGSAAPALPAAILTRMGFTRYKCQSGFLMKMEQHGERLKRLRAAM